MYLNSLTYPRILTFSRVLPYPQGIYPVMVVILVSTQLSYITNATQSTPTHSSSDDTGGSAGSQYWRNARGGGSSQRNVDRVNINVHELSVVQSDLSVNDNKIHTETDDIGKPNMLMSQV
jgi:hypothetical protein